MSFSDQRFVTFLLFCVAFYVMTQIMAGGTQKEGMTENEKEFDLVDYSVQTPQEPEQQSIAQTPMPASISEEIWTPATLPSSITQGNNLIQPVTSQPANWYQSEGTPAYNQSQPENTNWYQPPALEANQSSTTAVMQQINSGTQEYLFQTPNEVVGENAVSEAANFYPDPVDVDSVFWTSRPNVDPRELYPTPDGGNVPLFSDYNENPSLNKNFLQNRFSTGITTTKDTRKSNLDLRGAPSNTVPLSIVSPWNVPSVLPDFYRKTVGDVS